MIKVKLNGRLGNQMFQYAFGISVAKKLNTSVQFTINDFSDEVLSFFESSLEAFGLKPGKFQKWLYIKREEFGFVNSIVEQQDKKLQYFKDYCIYDGYFQNECYFKDYFEAVKFFFKVNQNDQLEFEKLKSLYDFENSIIVHARLKDYTTWNIEGLGGVDLSLPKRYYTNALIELGYSVEHPIVLISDDNELAIKLLDDSEKIKVMDASPGIAFQAMMGAKKLIISNSSFAWWAAYLNPNNPIVMAPKYWLGFKVQREYPVGIIPSKFHAVEF